MWSPRVDFLRVVLWYSRIINIFDTLFEHAATARLKRIADRAVTANHFGGMIAELVPNSKTAANSFASHIRTTSTGS